MTLTDSTAVRMRLAREHAGLTLTELADTLGISRYVLQQYERGMPCTRAIRIAWAIACSVDHDWLETGRDPQWAN